MKLKFTNGNGDESDIIIKGKCKITDYDTRYKTPDGKDLTVDVDGENFSIMNGTELKQDSQTVEMNANKYSIFTAIAGMDGDGSNLTEKDIAKAKKAYNDGGGEWTKLLELGVTEIRYDSHAGVATIVIGEKELLRIDFQTWRECMGIRPDRSIWNEEEIQDVSATGFYSLRCVKNRSIVSKLTELPICDASNGNVPITMVVDSVAYFECSASDEKWVRSETRACQESEKMDFFLSGDRLYVCDELWRLANVSDLNVSCTEDNLEQEYVLNDRRHACTKEGWIVLDYPASELGYCGTKLQDVIATNSNGMTFICTKYGWIEPDITVVYGECDEKNRFKAVEFQKKSYFCDENGSWRGPSGVEYSIGFCTDSLDGTLKTEDYDLYKCESGRWYVADAIEYLGPCNASKTEDTTVVASSKFLCTGKGWVSGMAIEDAHGFCVAAKNDSVVEYSGQYYKCIADEFRWNREVFEDYAPPCDSTTYGEKITVGGVEYTCDESYGRWHVPLILPPILIYPTNYSNW